MMAESPIETHVKPSRGWDEASLFISVLNFIFIITTNVPRRRTLNSNFLKICDRSILYGPSMETPRHQAGPKGFSETSDRPSEAKHRQAQGGLRQAFDLRQALRSLRQALRGLR